MGLLLFGQARAAHMSAVHAVAVFWASKENSSRILKKAKDFTRLAWSLVFLEDKSKSILHFRMKTNSVSLWKILADARELCGSEIHISRVVGTGRDVHRRKER